MVRLQQEFGIVEFARNPEQLAEILSRDRIALAPNCHSHKLAIDGARSAGFRATTDRSGALDCLADLQAPTIPDAHQSRCQLRQDGQLGLASARGFWLRLELRSRPRRKWAIASTMGRAPRTARWPAFSH